MGIPGGFSSPMSHRPGVETAHLLPDRVAVPVSPNMLGIKKTPHPSPFTGRSACHRLAVWRANVWT